MWASGKRKANPKGFILNKLVPQDFVIMNTNNLQPEGIECYE